MRLLLVCQGAARDGRGVSLLATVPAWVATWARFLATTRRAATSGLSGTGITAANVGKLRRQQVRLPGTADSSPIYLRGVRVHGRAHDVFFRNDLIAASPWRSTRLQAAVLWRFKPRGCSSGRAPTGSPARGPICRSEPRRYIYAEAPNGRVYKLTVATGAVSQVGVDHHAAVALKASARL